MNRRLEILDGVRGIAVMIVFLSHTSGRGQQLSSGMNFHGIGHIGVYLFFTLSAFLIASKLFNGPLTKKTVGEYFVNRFFRIAPLYYLLIISVYVGQMLTGQVYRDYLYIDGGLLGVFQHIFFLKGDGIFWTIPVFVRFYLFAPLIVWGLLKLKKKGVYLLTGLAITYFLFYVSNQLLVYTRFAHILAGASSKGGNYDVFFSGVIAAYFLRFHKPALKKYQKIISEKATVFYSFILLATLIFVSKRFLFFSQPIFPFRYLSLLYGAVFSLFILSLNIGNRGHWYLRNKLIIRIGKYGYSFYLLHFLVIQFVNEIDSYAPIKFAFSFIMLFFVSGLVYQLIEKPSVQLARFVNKIIDGKFFTFYYFK